MKSLPLLQALPAVLAASFLMTSCSKIDVWDLLHPPHKNKSGYDISEFSRTSYTAQGDSVNTLIFKKRYAGNSRHVTGISALINSKLTDMKVQSAGSWLLLTNRANGDTMLLARMNKTGNPAEAYYTYMRRDNNLNAYSSLTHFLFYYTEAEELSNVRYDFDGHEDSLHFRYDDKSDLIEVEGALPQDFYTYQAVYTYDYNKRVNGKVLYYQTDGLTDDLAPLYLLSFLGYLDLYRPAYLRSSAAISNDRLPKAEHVSYTKNESNASGYITAYQTALYTDPQPQYSTFRITWRR